MTPSAKEFFPRPIELASLDADRPNARDLGDGMEVVVFLRGRRPVVFRDLCPHMGAPLSGGPYDAHAGRLSCPWHGYVYDALTGAFLENPNDATFACMKGLYASYKPDQAPRLRLSPLACEVDGGLIWVRRPGVK